MTPDMFLAWGRCKKLGGVTQDVKTAVPSTSEQTVLPDEGFESMKSVVVAAIPYVESNNSAGGVTVAIA